MSAPWGGHPSFGALLQWAESVGCQVRQGVVHPNNGEAYNFTHIRAPSGRHYIDVGTQHGEFLAPTTVARIERRLGLKSPFPSIPDGFED